MPNFSGVWDLKDQVQAIAAGRWTGVPTFELYAWGYNIGGRLGDNTLVNKSSPVQIGVLTNWSQVSAGQFNIACVTTGGTLFTWGINTYGQLGHNDRINRSSPVQVGALTNWAQVSVGTQHTACIKTDGTMWTWGRNDLRGELGHNDRINRSSPVQVGALTNWAQVSAGSAATACVTTAGTLFTWGNYTNLGHNDRINRSSPVQVGALTNWAQVSTSNDFTACVTTAGTLFTWGYNGGTGGGRLGHNDRINRSSPVQVGALTNWAQVSLGSGMASCVKTNGTLFTWGINSRGQLGDGNVVSRSSPVQVGALTNWAQVSAGLEVTASIKTDGTMWTWGLNNNGQLGDCTVVNRSSPVQIGALTDWSQVVADGAIAILQGVSN